MAAGSYPVLARLMPDVSRAQVTFCVRDELVSMDMTLELAIALFPAARWWRAR